MSVPHEKLQHCTILCTYLVHNSLKHHTLLCSGFPIYLIDRSASLLFDSDSILRKTVATRFSPASDSCLLHPWGRRTHAGAAHRCALSCRGHPRCGAARSDLRGVALSRRCVFAYPIPALRSRRQCPPRHPRASEEPCRSGPSGNDAWSRPRPRLDAVRRSLDGRGGEPRARRGQSSTDRPAGRGEPVTWLLISSPLWLLIGHLVNRAVR